MSKRVRANAGSPLANRTVFVGGPFSSALRFDDAGEITGFDEVLRAKFERVYAFLRDQGAGILSSHLAESFGEDVHETTLVQRDNAWLRACDLYLAVLPFNTDEPYRSDGTFVEIGMAIGIGRPCLLLVEEPDAAAWSYYVRNLGAERLVSTIPLPAGEATWLEAAGALLAESSWVGDAATHIDDPDTLHSLVRGGVAGHTISVRGLTLKVPAGALSPRYDASLRALCDVLQSHTAERLLLIGGGAGELAVAALGGANASVTVVEPDAHARGVITSNVEGHGLGGRARVVTAASGGADFDLLAFHAPPSAVTGNGPFDARRATLIEALRHSLPKLSADASIYIAVTSFNQSSDLFEMLAGAGWSLAHISPSQTSATSPVGLWKGVRIQT